MTASHLRIETAYYPGWTARIDNRAAPIYEVNGAMRGVMVPAGVHIVTMRCRPTGTFVAGLLTLVGFAGAVLLQLRRA